MDLVKLARDGNQPAFLEIFDEHHVPLFRFAYRLTGSTADAEDIVQECFLGLLRPHCAFDPLRTPLRIYLFGVVRNQCLKRLRKRETPGDNGHLPTSSPSPEREAWLNEMEGFVANAVKALPEIQREVLILAHYEQMPLAEISRILDLELGAVKSRLQRARANLKQSLAIYSPDQERRR